MGQKQTRFFEDVWTVKGKTYIREYCTIKNKSIKRETPYKSEYYLPDELGKYKGFLDGVKLRKVQGSSYGIDNAYGSFGSDYVAIREEYFNKKYHKPSVFYLDIETSVGTQPGSTGFPNADEALEPIVLIQVYSTIDDKIYILGLEEWTHRKDYTYDQEVIHTKYDSEKDLINGYLDLFKDHNPLVVTAWNAHGFDFPYIFNRLKNLKISTSKLSNYGKVDLKRINDNFNLHQIISTGHVYIDTMEVYKKFVFKNVSSYSLDNIAQIETDVQKVKHDNYVKFDDFRIGKYVITGKETEEHKKTKLHRCAVALETCSEEQKPKFLKYIKSKSYSDFVHYGVMDVVVLKQITEAQNLIGLMLSISEQMGAKMSDTLGTLKVWNVYITNTLAKDKLILPPVVERNQPDVIGGYVREPQVGKQYHLVSTDYASMYPMNMAAFNLSPETRIDEKDQPQEVREINKLFSTQDEEKILQITDEQWSEVKRIAKKYNIGFNVGGAIFSREKQGVIPRLVVEIYNARKRIKKQMWLQSNKVNDLTKELHRTKDKSRIKILKQEIEEAKNQQDLLNTSQMSKKLLINSVYGALVSLYFPLFNEQMAQAITGNGRYLIRKTSDNVEKRLQELLPQKKPYSIYGDTDSVMFSLDPFVKAKKITGILESAKFCDNFYKKILDPNILDTIQEVCENLNAYDSKSYIAAEREIIGDCGIFIAKKKYTIRVRDNEGEVYEIDSPYMKVQGLDIIKGGTSDFSKKYLKAAVPVLMDRDDRGIKNWFQETRSDFLNWPLDEISKTQGVSKISNPNWGKIINGRKVSIPFGSRVCICTNEYIRSQNLEEEYTPIEGGDRVQIIYINQPNPMKTEAFAFNDIRFAERFKDQIDYDTTFSKFFVKPLQGMLDALGIDLNNQTQELDIW